MSYFLTVGLVLMPFRSPEKSSLIMRGVLIHQQPEVPSDHGDNGQGQANGEE